MPTTAAIEQVQRAYIAYYNRPGDPGGVEYWADRLDAGETLESIIDAFASSAEAASLYEGVATGDLIVTVYSQAFGREPDEEGRDYWAGRIDSGELSPGEALLTIVEGASNNDLLIITDKIDFAVQVTGSFVNDEAYNAADLETMTSALQQIDGSGEALTAALAVYGLSEAGQSNSIVGSWRLDNGGNPDEQIALNFYEDGTYIHWETSISSVTGEAVSASDPDSPSGYAGTETGTYTWDEETSTLTVLEIISDTNGDWGLSSLAGGGSIELTVVGSTFYDGEGQAFVMA